MFIIIQSTQKLHLPLPQSNLYRVKPYTHSLARAAINWDHVTKSME